METGDLGIFTITFPLSFCNGNSLGLLYLAGV